MASTKSAVTVILGVVVVMALFPALASSVHDNTGTQSVTNESVTASNTSYVELDQNDLVSGSETVYWLNSTSGNYEVVSSPDDYELNESDGTIIANSTGSVGDGDSLKVSYDWQATDGSTTTIAGVILPLALILVLLVLANEVTGGL